MHLVRLRQGLNSQTVSYLIPIILALRGSTTTLREVTSGEITASETLVLVRLGRSLHPTVTYEHK